MIGAENDAIPCLYERQTQLTAYAEPQVPTELLRKRHRLEPRLTCTSSPTLDLLPSSFGCWTLTQIQAFFHHTYSRPVRATAQHRISLTPRFTPERRVSPTSRRPGKELWRGHAGKKTICSPWGKQQCSS